MKCILMVLCCTAVNIILVALQKLKITENSIFLQVKIPRRTIDVESAQDVTMASSQSVEYMFLELYIQNYYFFSFMNLREYLYYMCYAQVYYFYIDIRRSQWPCSLRRGSAAARLLGLWVRIPLGTRMSVCRECCVLSGRGLCVGLITHPEESYQVWRV
jgi:hypothetical protein